MQTTVKHTKGFVAYLAVGERAVEIRLFPWSFQVHTKRTEFGRRKPKIDLGCAVRVPDLQSAASAREFDASAKATLGVDPKKLQPEPVLPGFKEPEHPPQTNTALG